MSTSGNRYSKFFRGNNNYNAKAAEESGYVVEECACNSNSSSTTGQNSISNQEVRVNEPDVVTYNPPLSTLPVLNRQRARCESEPRFAVHPKFSNIIVSAHFTRKLSPAPPVHTGAQFIGAVEFSRSMDSGQSWEYLGDAPSYLTPNNTLPVFHFSLAFGPGPSHKSYRLYCVITLAEVGVVDPVTGSTTGVGGPFWNRAGLIMSDNIGTTFSPTYTMIDPLGLNLPSPIGEFNATPLPGQPLLGTIPSIAVDTNKLSPNYGNVYITYGYQWWDNHIFTDFESGDGSKLIVSRDFGQTFTGVELDSAPINDILPTGTTVSTRYSRPFTAARPAISSNGEVYIVSPGYVYYEIPPHTFADIEFVRMFFQVQRVTVTGSTIVKHTPTVIRDNIAQPAGQPPGTLQFNTDSSRSYNIVADPECDSTLYATFHEYDISVAIPRGKIHVYKSVNSGGTWDALAFPAVPVTASLPTQQSSLRPSLAISPKGDKLIVRFLAFEDWPIGTLPTSNLLTVGNYYSVSTDGGCAFSAPKPISLSRWVANAGRAAVSSNGVGFYHQVEFLNKKTTLSLYGDARNGSTVSTDIDTALTPNIPTFGNIDVFAAIINVPNAQNHFESDDEDACGCSNTYC